MCNAAQLIKSLLIGVAISCLSGCVMRPDLTDARVKNGADEAEIVEVTLSADDARKIKGREIYFSVVLVDCKNNEHRYPIEPYIAGKLASTFDFPVEGELITIQASLPEQILARFQTPCVALEGGSYILGRLDSAPVPLVRFEG